MIRSSKVKSDIDNLFAVRNKIDANQNSFLAERGNQLKCK
jgi:hypothetical protein